MPSDRAIRISDLGFRISDFSPTRPIGDGDGNVARPPARMGRGEKGKRGGGAGGQGSKGAGEQGRPTNPVILSGAA